MNNLEQTNNRLTCISISEGSSASRTESGSYNAYNIYSSDNFSAFSAFPAHIDLELKQTEELRKFLKSCAERSPNILEIQCDSFIQASSENLKNFLRLNQNYSIYPATDSNSDNNILKLQVKSSKTLLFKEFLSEPAYEEYTLAHLCSAFMQTALLSNNWGSSRYIYPVKIACSAKEGNIIRNEGKVPNLIREIILPAAFKDLSAKGGNPFIGLEDKNIFQAFYSWLINECRPSSFKDSKKANAYTVCPSIYLFEKDYELNIKGIDGIRLDSSDFRSLHTIVNGDLGTNLRGSYRFADEPIETDFSYYKNLGELGIFLNIKQDKQEKYKLNINIRATHALRQKQDFYKLANLSCGYSSWEAKYIIAQESDYEISGSRGQPLIIKDQTALWHMKGSIGKEEFATLSVVEGMKYYNCPAKDNFTAVTCEIYAYSKNNNIANIVNLSSRVTSYLPNNCLEQGKRSCPAAQRICIPYYRDYVHKQNEYIQYFDYAYIRHSALSSPFNGLNALNDLNEIHETNEINVTFVYPSKIDKLDLIEIPKLQSITDLFPGFSYEGKLEELYNYLHIGGVKSEFSKEGNQLIETAIVTITPSGHFFKTLEISASDFYRKVLPQKNEFELTRSDIYHLYNNITIIIRHIDNSDFKFKIIKNIEAKPCSVSHDLPGIVAVISCLDRGKNKINIIKRLATEIPFKAKLETVAHFADFIYGCSIDSYGFKALACKVEDGLKQSLGGVFTVNNYIAENSSQYFSSIEPQLCNYFYYNYDYSYNEPYNREGNHRINFRQFFVPGKINCLSSSKHSYKIKSSIEKLYKISQFSPLVVPADEITTTDIVEFMRNCPSSKNKPRKFECNIRNAYGAQTPSTIINYINIINIDNNNNNNFKYLNIDSNIAQYLCNPYYAASDDLVKKQNYHEQVFITGSIKCPNSRTPAILEEEFYTTFVLPKFYKKYYALPQPDRVSSFFVGLLFPDQAPRLITRLRTYCRPVQQSNQPRKYIASSFQNAFRPEKLENIEGLRLINIEVFSITVNLELKGSLWPNDASSSSILEALFKNEGKKINFPTAGASALEREQLDYYGQEENLLFSEILAARPAQASDFFSIAPDDDSSFYITHAGGNIFNITIETPSHKLSSIEKEQFSSTSTISSAITNYKLPKTRPTTASTTSISATSFTSSTITTAATTAIAVTSPAITTNEPKITLAKTYYTPGPTTTTLAPSISTSIRTVFLTSAIPNPNNHVSTTDLPETKPTTSVSPSYIRSFPITMVFKAKTFPTRSGTATSLKPSGQRATTSAAQYTYPQNITKSTSLSNLPSNYFLNINSITSTNRTNINNNISRPAYGGMLALTPFSIPILTVLIIIICLVSLAGLLGLLTCRLCKKLNVRATAHSGGNPNIIPTIARTKGEDINKNTEAISFNQAEDLISSSIEITELTACLPNNGKPY